MKKLQFNDYYDKVLGCYTGMNIGGTLGAPFECYRGVYDITWFQQDISQPIPNDDLDLQLVWLRAAELEGEKLDSHVLVEYWNTYISATLSEYGTGKNNFNMGILPPLSGRMRNLNKDSNGAWIRTEIWACLCAGNPALAANYAYYDSCVDHSTEGVYSAVFCAVIQSAAFFERDIITLANIGLSYIPQDCGIAKAVRCVIEGYNEGKTWKEMRKELFKLVPSSFGNMGGYWKGTPEVPANEQCPVQMTELDIPIATHGYDAPWHIGAILIGLLYGEYDMGKTVCIATNLGEDTDCTAGLAGAVLGIIQGEKGISEKWKNACSNRISTWTLRIDQNLCLPKTIEELAYRIVKIAPKFLGSKCNTLGFEPTERYDREGQGVTFEIMPIDHFEYRPKAFAPQVQEDSRELISEQGTTVRKHFGMYNLLIKFDDDLVKIKEGVSKTLNLVFLNRLFTPQYLTVRFLDLPEGWESNLGKEFCIGLEHWHGSRNDNSIEWQFTPHGINKGSYTIVMEISTNGRMTKNYLPITFINGGCWFDNEV